MSTEMYLYNLRVIKVTGGFRNVAFEVMREIIQLNHMTLSRILNMIEKRENIWHF